MTDLTPAARMELRELAEKATPRPYVYDGMHYEINAPSATGYFMVESEAPTIINNHEVDEFGHQYSPDLAYLTAAANLAPALLDEVERLQAELAEAAKTASDYWYAQTVDCKFRIAKLEQACNMALKELIELQDQFGLGYSSADDYWIVAKLRAALNGTQS